MGRHPHGTRIDWHTPLGVSGSDHHRLMGMKSFGYCYGIERMAMMRMGPDRGGTPLGTDRPAAIKERMGCPLGRKPWRSRHFIKDTTVCVGANE